MTRRRSRPRYILAVLVLAALTLVTLSARGSGNSTLRSVRDGLHSALSSVQSGVHDALRPVGNFLTGAVDYGSEKAENAKLRQQLEAAESAQAKARYDQQQADQVLRYEHIPFVSQYKTVVAEVTGQPSSNIEATITIGKGTSSGVAVGEPVVTPAGLAGQVTEATSGSATITLISDPTLSIGVGLAGNEVGTARSTGPGHPMAVEAIGATPAVRKGDELFTTAITQEYPPGIPVARVTSVSGGAGGATPDILAAPYAHTGNLSYVTVVMALPS